MLTSKQIIELTQLKDAIYASKELYRLEFEKSLMMPYSYGNEIEAYMQWMYNNKLVVQNYIEIEEEYFLNYKNDHWYKTISEVKAIQALAFGIRRDRFVDGFLASTIKGRSFEKLVDRLVELHNRKDEKD